MRQSQQDGSVTAVIPSDPKEARRLQDHIESQLKQFRFEDGEIFSIKLALEEALVNAMKHGNQMDRSKNVHIHYRIDASRFEVQICDEGAGFDPQDVPDPLAVENLERPCGRGLLLMRHYMTEVNFHAPGNRLIMSKVRAARNGKHASSGAAHANGNGQSH